MILNRHTGDTDDTVATYQVSGSAAQQMNAGIVRADDIVAKNAVATAGEITLLRMLACGGIK